MFKKIFRSILTKIIIYIEYKMLARANKKRHLLRISEIDKLIERLKKHDIEYNSRLTRNGGNGNINWCIEPKLNKKAREFLEQSKDLWHGYEFKFPVGEVSIKLNGDFDILFSFPFYNDKGEYYHHRLSLAFKKNALISNGYLLEEVVFIEYKGKVVKINTPEDFTYAIQTFCFDQLIIEYDNKLLLKTVIDLE